MACTKASLPFANGREELKRFFDSFDADGDSKISPLELRQLLRLTIGEEVSVEEAEAVFRLVDSDGDGLLDLDDFTKLVGTTGSEVEDENNDEVQLREAFKLYEMDGKGFITEKSLKRMLSRLGASRPIELCRAIICRFDLNGDGLLSFDEFRAMMRR
ncbi:hypothetical protein HPP92_003319 [Vanilla planifolia]|uniref:EF-hand domain-containing protein n=1 Tax=Vanilla planifolia TaxID=51239 RepID=A0A835SFE0_VANPL|nr:hypothetical protein HPP92_003319 [Vanilla planifolia]